MNRVENILAKGEIAHYEQFPFLSQCFQKSSAANVSNASIGRKGRTIKR